MRKESEFLQGLEDYKKRTDIFAHPDTQEDKQIQQNLKRSTKGAINKLKLVKGARKQTQHSGLAFKVRD